MADHRYAVWAETREASSLEATCNTQRRAEEHMRRVAFALDGVAYRVYVLDRRHGRVVAELSR